MLTFVQRRGRNTSLLVICRQIIMAEAANVSESAIKMCANRWTD